MTKSKIKRLEISILRIKGLLHETRDMRPGSLSKQMRKSKDKYGAYWHLSYSHRGKGHTQYIRDELVAQIKAETANFRRFRTLVDRLVTLSIALSQAKIEIAKRDASEALKTRQS
jgi:hypothetical protein